MKARIVIFSFILLIGFLNLYRVQLLTIQLDNEIVKAYFFHQTTDFSIQWTHSVEKERWEEFFRVRDNTIIIDSTRFKTFGAGVPSNVGKDTFIKDGWVYMVDINRKIGEQLTIRTGETTNHQFIIDNKKYNFNKIEQAYTIKPIKVSLIKGVIYSLYK